MPRTFRIEIDGQEFDGQSMTAKDQFEVLHISLQHAAVISSLKENTSAASSVVAMGALSYRELERVERLALSSIVRAEDEVPVDRNLFRDRMEQYYLLLARVLQENLQGFWSLRQLADKGEQGELTEQSGQNQSAT